MILVYKVSRLFYIQINVGIPPPPIPGCDLSNIAEQMAYARARYRSRTQDINHVIQRSVLHPSRDQSTNQISIYFSRITNDCCLKLFFASKYNYIFVYHIIINHILIYWYILCTKAFYGIYWTIRNIWQTNWKEYGSLKKFCVQF